MPRWVKCSNSDILSRKSLLPQRSTGVMAIREIIELHTWPSIYDDLFLRLDYVPHGAKTRVVKDGRQIKMFGLFFIGARIPPSYAGIVLPPGNHFGHERLGERDFL